MTGYGKNDTPAFTLSVEQEMAITRKFSTQQSWTTLVLWSALSKYKTIWRLYVNKQKNDNLIYVPVTFYVAPKANSALS